MSEISAADLLQHFPLVSCLGEGQGVKDTSVQSCPSLPSILGNEGFTWVNLFHIKNSNAICIPVYFCILCYFFLHSHIARVNVYMLSVRAGGEQTLGARSCTSSLCLHPSVGPLMRRAPPASRCGCSPPTIGFGRHGHVSLFSSRRINAALTQGLQPPACLWGGPSGCTSAPPGKTLPMGTWLQLWLLPRDFPVISPQGQQLLCELRWHKGTLRG